MTKLSVWLIILSSLGSCSSKDKIPKEVLNQKQMQVVLWDMLKADALTPELVKKDSTLKTVAKNVELYYKVFAVNKITRTIFEKSYAFYERNPDLMRPLLDSINALQQRNLLKKYSQPKLLPDTAAKS